VGTGRGGTKLHASVAGSRVTAFLATAAPWEPYFTDNPRIINMLFLKMVSALHLFWGFGLAEIADKPLEPGMWILCTE
jgi:hypothetical protein